MKIIITSGPTNERIDSVMKITNMSTGTLGKVTAETMLNANGQYWEAAEQVEKIYYISTKMARKPVVPHGQEHKLEFVTVESTDDLLNALKDILTREKIDLVVHSAAVGDYKGRYSIRGEALAQDIVRALGQMPQDVTNEEIYNTIMGVIDNPSSVQDDSTKMSSYEPHLMTMMTLTPKVIGTIKKLSPDTKLVGFKLLDGVSQDELFQVADRLRVKNNADYIVANDLSKIGKGKHWAMIVGKDGIVRECQTKTEIASAIIDLTF